MTSISGASDVFHKTLSYQETWLLGAAIISSIPFHIRYLRNPMDKGQVTSINNSLLAIINGNRESPKLTQPLGVYATTLFSQSRAVYPRSTLGNLGFHAIGKLQKYFFKNVYG